MLCAIYCRLSKEDEDKGPESESIQNQKSLLLRFAVERGWDIFDIYVDDDYSGTDSGRPAFNSMLRAAQEKKFDLVLCKSQARFTRDMELVERYIHGKFAEWGIRFVTVADNADTAVKGNKKARQINGLINEWYLEDLSENVRVVFDMKRREGQYIGSSPLFGYVKDPKDKNKLVIDEEAAAVVRRIFRLATEGHRKQSIATVLNEQGVPNPTRYKELHGSSYRNGTAVHSHGLWSKTTVGRILSNVMYTGTMVQGRTKKISYKSKKVVSMPEENWFVVPGTHEAIIDAKTFADVQPKRNVRARADKNGELHPLAGLVRCMDCQSSMCKTRNNNEVYYLRCKLSVASGSRKLCTRHSIRLDRLISEVELRLRHYVENWFELGDIARFGKDTGPDQAEALGKELAAVEAALDKRIAALHSLYLDKISGLIGEAQFKEFNSSFLSDRKHLENQRNELVKRQNDMLDRSTDSKQDICNRVSRILQEGTANRELMLLAVEKIEVGEKDPVTKKQEIKIHWNF